MSEKEQDRGAWDTMIMDYVSHRQEMDRKESERKIELKFERDTSVIKTNLKSTLEMILNLYMAYIFATGVFLGYKHPQYAWGVSIVYFVLSNIRNIYIFTTGRSSKNTQYQHIWGAFVIGWIIIGMITLIWVRNIFSTMALVLLLDISVSGLGTIFFGRVVRE